MLVRVNMLHIINEHMYASIAGAPELSVVGGVYKQAIDYLANSHVG